MIYNSYLNYHHFIYCIGQRYDNTNSYYSQLEDTFISSTRPLTPFSNICRQPTVSHRRSQCNSLPA